MVLQAGVARLGLPSRHATDIPPSRMARARTTRPQCTKQSNNSRHCAQSRQHQQERRTLHTRTGTYMRGHHSITRGTHAGGTKRPTGLTISNPLHPRRQSNNKSWHHKSKRARHARALRHTPIQPPTALTQTHAGPHIDEEHVQVDPTRQRQQVCDTQGVGVSQGACASRVAGVCSHAGSNGAVGSSVRGREGAAWAGQRAHRAAPWSFRQSRSPR